MKKNKVIKLISISALVLFSLLPLSCEQIVGLGSSISIKGPVLSITGPVPEYNQKDIQVSSLFELKGTTTGESQAARMEITMTRYDSGSNILVMLGREWRYDKGWQWKEDSDIPWKPYTLASYGSAGDATNLMTPAWMISDNGVEWNLPILLAGLPKGDYYFTVRVWDSVGHTDSGSIAKLKVIYDNEEPYLVITNLSTLRPGTGSQGNPDYPKDPDTDQYTFDTYIYDPINNWDATYTFINRWVNNKLEFGWEIDKAIIGDYTLVIEITNKHDLRTKAGKVLYYRYEWSGGVLPRYGMFSDAAVSIGDPIGVYTKVGNAIPVTDLVPRNLISGLPTGELLPSDQYVPMQIVAWLADGNGATDSVPHKGWFPCFPKTDEPWAHIAFGYKEDPKKVTPQTAPELAFMWTGQSSNTNLAYDNTAIQKLEWELYKLKDDGLLPLDSGEDGSITKPWIGSVSFSGQNPRESWGFEASEGYGIGRYKIAVKVTDVDSNIGTYSAYFSIESNATPTIRVLEKPNTYETLFGDNAGNFSIQGIAQIADSGDQLRVDRVSIAWIKPGDNLLENTLLYTDRNYTNWDKGKDGPLTNGYFQDTAGNRVWEIPSGSIVFDSLTDGNNNVNGQEDYSFVKTLNLFSDLDVAPGKNPSGAQTFLIRVYSNGSNNKPKSSVTRVDAPGDDIPPAIEITKIFITKWNGAYYDLPVEYEKKLSGFEMIPAIDEQDKVRLTGTWTDDSLVAWSGLSPSALKALFKNFSVNWVGEDNEINFINPPIGSDFSINGTWETGEFTFTNRNNDPIVLLTASITDHNNRVGIDEIAIILETDNPTLTRITSVTGDGEYSENKDTDPDVSGSRYIDIFLEFNKHVKFFENDGLPPFFPPIPAKAPYLALNNGGRAYYYDGNGDTRLTFRYFIDGKVIPSLSTAESGYGGISSGGRLNVEGIVWTTEYPKAKCVSVDGGTPVIISDSVFHTDTMLSLAGSKNIVIDKDKPVVTSIVTTAGDTKPHGRGSPIYITVNFSETVQVSALAKAVNFYLKLKGGNLKTANAQAVFDNVAGASSVTFRYDVAASHDTSVSGEYLGIDSIYMDGSFSISDIAGNIFDLAAANVSLPSGGALNRSIIIDTVAPGIPSIDGLVANRNYYGDNISFNIKGLESTNVTVEYCLDYNPASPASAVWVSVQINNNVSNNPPNTYKIQGNTPNLYYIEGIPLELNGIYNIAARQRDNATEPNVSANPAAGNVLSNVKVDRGALLSRLGSGTSDGIYGQGREIEIDLVFRIPVYLPGHTFDASGNLTSTSTASLTMANMSQGSPVPKAALKRKSADNRTYTFSFIVGSNHRTDHLDVDVDGLDLGNLQFYDGSAIATATLVNEWIDIADVTPDVSNFRLPKSIGILTGNPVAITGGINPGTNELRITFDRDIYSGDTETKLLIKQVATGYRIPTVLSEDRFAELFIGRSDIPGFTATPWRDLGNELYQKGSNGANAGTGNTLIPDTSVKYVLKYEVDAGDSTTGVVSGITTAVLRLDLLNGLRAAEALSFYALDKEVGIVNDTYGRPRILRVSLAVPKALPVKGAVYQWTIPHGFVKDFLENPNGGTTTGYDSALTSGNADVSGDDDNQYALRIDGLESPVIRINKGLIETITGSGNARQARQPLRTNFKIDCRTPDTVMRYRTRQTTDNVGRLIMRNGTTMTNGSSITGTGTSAVSRNLPNLGSQTSDNNGTQSFLYTKRRPQSGNATNTFWNPTTESFQATAGGAAYVNGQNFWTPMGDWPGTYTTYTTGSSIQIGENNYLTGGMEVHINAQAAGRTIPQVWDTVSNAYEAAYRSVLVYNNTSVNGNGNTRDLSSALAANDDNGAPFTNRGRTRVYIRGGDTTSGDPSIPDFPIGRDRTLAKKARLLTPFDITSTNQASVFGTTNNYNGTRTDSDIVTTFNQNAQYLWFWVTWGVNVPAYVDFFSGEMAAETTGYSHYHVATKDFYASWTYSKEHYAVLPGRTTITESRNAYGTQADGSHGGHVYIGSVVNSPTPTDIP